MDYDTAWVLFPFNVPRGAPLVVEENKQGHCWHTARGIVGIKKSDYNKIGGYERCLSYISRSSDSVFFKNMNENLKKVIMRREFGLFHVGHPGSNANRGRQWSIEQCTMQ